MNPLFHRFSFKFGFIGTLLGRQKSLQMLRQAQYDDVSGLNPKAVEGCSFDRRFVMLVRKCTSALDKSGFALPSVYCDFGRLWLVLMMGVLNLIVISCGVAVRAVDEGAEKIGTAFQEGRRGRLTEEEQAWAKTAWKYFENNYNP